MTDAPSSASYDDDTVRKRIGPWSADGVPDLSAFDPDTNFFVRAAAGSGKTTALVARMVALVRVGVSPGEMAAITFTRKAAGEMTTRFVQELRRARTALPDGSDERARVDAALQNAQETFIGTVHAFCARLLRERPIAANLPPDFTAGLDDRDERALRDRAWQQYVQSVRKERPERLNAITDLGLEPGDLETYFERLCTHPELEPYVDAPDAVPDLDAAVATVRDRLADWQTQRPSAPSNGRDAVMRAFDKAQNMVDYQDLDAPAQQAAFLELFADVSSSEKAKVTLKCWGSRGSESYEWARTLRDEALPALVRDTVEPALRPWRAYVHKEVVAFTAPAVETFAELRREEGMLTFHDLLLRTRTLLRDRPAVRSAIQEQYPRLLVDEFQDTDPLQAEILFYLTSRDPTETTWTNCRPTPGSLFIVGDDKQSIYRFRRADMDVFTAVGRRMEATGGEAVVLTKNFRSHTTICQWCNEAFGTIFDDASLADVQARYTDFDPVRPPGRDDTGLRRIEIGNVYRNKADDIAERDARRIARFIRGAYAGRLDDTFYGPAGDERAVFAGGADYDDFLILTREKKRLAVYAKRLAEHGIPYTITGSEDLGDADELNAITDLMTCALRPDDGVACVAYLKGALVGASDDDLYRYKQAGGAFDRMHEPVPQAVLRDLPSDLRTRMQGAFERLQRARTLLRTKRPSVAVTTLVEELGLLAGAAHPASPSEGSLRAGYVLRTLTYVQTLTARGLSWADITEELQRVIDGEEDLDGMTLETGSDDAVRIMNVHQAKGLEAPVVFLADPYSSGRGPSVKRHLRRDTGALVAPIVQGEGYYERVTHPPLGWETPDGDGFKTAEERHEAAEERRLLYVAATRAKKLLVVSRYRSDRWSEDKGNWAPLYPHLDEDAVPELEAPSLPDAPDAQAAPAPDLEARAAERAQRIRDRCAPSYQEESVTDAEARSADDSLHPGTDGYGDAFGEALHTLLEQCVRHRNNPTTSDPEIRGTLAMNGADVTPEAVERIRTMLERFLASSLWADLQDADRVYAEYPVTRQVTNGEGPPVLQRGVVDLAYRRKGKWTVVDFKSDRVERDPREVLHRRHAYVEQVRTYGECWADLFDDPVAEAALWFADTGTRVPVAPSNDSARPGAS